jgi:2'-5' RNA ligase
MNGQLRLDLNDGDPNAGRRPKFPERIFLGIMPDDAAALQAEETTKKICEIHAIRGSRLLRQRFHVSLQHIGDYKRLKSKVLYAASLAGAAISIPEFDVIFDRAESFAAPPRRDRPRQYPAVLRGGSEPLFGLHRLLAAAMRKLNLKPSDSFVPHMTMVYADKAITPQPNEPLRWTVREFVLIHSERGLTKYNILDRWPLRG